MTVVEYVVWVTGSIPRWLCGLGWVISLLQDSVPQLRCARSHSNCLIGISANHKMPLLLKIYSRQNPECYYICEVFVDRSLGSWEEIILSQWVLNAVVSVLTLINRPTEEDRQADTEGRDWSDIATSQGCWQPWKLKEAGRILPESL